MIKFRCPYCRRSYLVSEEKIGEKRQCGCGETLRVPRRSGGSARHRTVGQRLIEIFVYGFGGAFLGFLLGMMPLYTLGRYSFRLGWQIGLYVAVAGFLIGALGGEKGIDWIGRKLRDRDRLR
jgi:hypothetical protein